MLSRSSSDFSVNGGLFNRFPRRCSGVLQRLQMAQTLAGRRGGTTTAVDLDGSAAERFALVVRKAVGGTLSSALEKVKGAA